MRNPASGRPAQLNDRDWLARRYAQDGDNVIALELGVSRGSVARARGRLGISAAGVGRRRGSTLRVQRPAPSDESSASITLTGTAMMMLERFQSESRVGGPAATLELVAVRIHAVNDARLAGDQLAFEDSLIAAISALGLVHQHQRRLRRAA